MNKRTHEFKMFVRHPFAWPGGYPLYAVMTDGGIICRNCAKSEAKIIIRSTRDNERDGWNFADIDVNWEDEALFCDHCGEQIASAYGDD